MEIVCRDRHGLYAEGARIGAPQAREVADRFHLVQNLRNRIEQHLSGPRQPLIGPTEVRQAEAICVKPRRLSSERQIGMLMALNDAVPDFAAIRRLAIRFQSLLRHHNGMKPDQ